MPNQQPNLEQQVNQPSSPPNNLPQKSKFNLKYILIVVILAAIVGGGILAYQYWWLPETEIFVKKIEKIPIEDRLIFKPNFDEIINVIEDGDILWALTNGGILKYERKLNKVKIYSVKDGLTGSGYTNMVKRGDYIWVATENGISRLDIKNEKIKSYYAKKIYEKDSWADAFARLSYDTMTGLPSNANLELFLDPYTDGLWAISFKGISKYQDAQDDWISFGQAGKISLSECTITNLVFNRDFVVADVVRGGNLIGGIVAFDKEKNEWVELAETEEFILQRNDDKLLVASKDKFWVAARPIGYNSCADKDKSKASQVLSYSKNYGWNFEEKINKQILLDEEVFEMKYEDPYLMIYLRGSCDNSKLEKHKLIKFNTKKDEIEKIEMIDNYEEEKRIQKEKQALELIKNIENILKEPTRKEILFPIGDELLFNVYPTFLRSGGYEGENELKQFNENLIENKEANIFWKDIEKKEKEFLEIYNLSDRYLIPLECNKFNVGGRYIYLITNEEGGMGSSEIHLIVRYDKEKKEPNLLKEIKMVGEGEEDLLDPFRCDDKQYLVFTREGVFNYDFEKQEKIFLDKNNFKKPVLIGGYDLKYLPDRTKIYFLTEDFQLGIFNINDSHYQYFSLENIQEIGIDFKPIDLELKEIRGTKLYFTSEKADGYLFIYDKEFKKWNKIWIPQEIKGRIKEVKVFKGLVWIITDEGVFDNIIYVGNENNLDSIRRVSINNGIITTSRRTVRGGGAVLDSKIFKTEDKLFIVGENGIWIFR